MPLGCRSRWVRGKPLGVCAVRHKLIVVFIGASLAIGLGWQATAIAGGSQGGYGSQGGSQGGPQGGYGSQGGPKHGNEPPGVYGPHGPVITTSSSIVHPGDYLTVSCKNFAPREWVTFTLHSGRVTLGKTSTNSKGSCSTTVKIPSNTRPGNYTIEGTGKTGDSASTDILVVTQHNNHHNW